MLEAHGVLRVELGELVGELAEGAAEPVVFGVVGGGLDAVAAQDGGFAVVVVGFVGGEVDFAEEPARLCQLLLLCRKACER